MNVGHLCRRQPISVQRSDEVTKAAQLMREEHVGYLVVVESGNDGLQRAVGVLTDRDIVITVVARETDPRTLRVEDIMTEKPVTVSATDSIENAVREMRRIGVRRLPTVGRRGELLGIVSMDDILEALSSELDNIVASVRNEQSIEGALRT